jgi:dTDP-4-dehydrorhamnose reductase
VIVVTGAGGQLGHALLEAFPHARGLTRTEWDVTHPAPAGLDAELVLHAAAWTDVDGAEDDPQEAAAVNVGGVQHAAGLGAPLVSWSSDYVFDGSKREPYVESDATGPLGAYGRTKLHGEAAAGEHAWIVRSSWLFGPTSKNFVRTMLRLGAELPELRVVDDQVGNPTFTRHLAEASLALVERCPPGIYHLAGGGSCSWYELASAIMTHAGLPARVVPIGSDELDRPAPRPACSILRSEHACTPTLPPWQTGLEACLYELSQQEVTS